MKNKKLSSEAVSFRGWPEALGQVTPMTLRESMGLIIKWYLGWCKRKSVGASFHSARQFLEEAKAEKKPEDSIGKEDQMNTLDKAFTEIVNSSEPMEVKMARFIEWVHFTYTLCIEYFDELLECGCENGEEADEILDERAKTRKLIRWAESLSPYDDVEEAIAVFHSMPKPEGDPFGYD